MPTVRRSTRRRPGRLIAAGAMLAMLLVVAMPSTPLALAAPLAQTAGDQTPETAPKPAGSPAAKPSGVPASPRTWSEWLWSGDWGTPFLTILSATLIGIALYAWARSNLAERKPNAEQLEQIRGFVEGHFARYVAQSLAATDGGGSPATAVNVANDKAWRKVFAHHVEIHSGLYQLSRPTAMRVYTTYVDDAVRRELANLGAKAATRFSG